MSRATFIIVAWNSSADLPVCLTVISRLASAEDEVIVVDNGSTDGSADVVSSEFPEFRLLRLHRNLGYAGGVNVGIQHATGEFLFCLNPDVALDQDWLREMMHGLGEEGVGIVGCKLLFPDGLLQHAGGVLRWPRAIADHRGYACPDDGRWEQPADVDYVTGAAWGFKRSFVEEVGLLDEAFWPGYYEEVDYCLRAQQAGWRVVYVPKARAVHKESVSLRRDSRRYLRAFHQNRIRFVIKWQDPERVISDFVPAEMSWLQKGASAGECRVMAGIYKRTLLSLLEMLARRSSSLPHRDAYRSLSDALVKLQHLATDRSRTVTTIREAVDERQ